MTKEFYMRFLGYISPKELKNLYSNLYNNKQKRKFSVNGYTPPKAPPVAMLAPQIAKNEKIFFEILEEIYIPNFDNYDDATNSFTPDTAVTCLVYLVKNRIPDEPSLMSLLEKKIDVREEIQTLPVSGKAKKKTEEFREKYLAARRELLQLRENHKELQTENTKLKSELSVEINKLNITKETFRQFKEESGSTITQLKTQISKLELSIIEYQSVSTVQKKPILIIMDADETNEADVDILTYDNILKLLDVSDRYEKILLVANDIPFSAKRKIYKIDAIQEKLVSFSTKQEMLEYAKQWRNI